MEEGNCKIFLVLIFFMFVYRFFLSCFWQAGIVSKDAPDQLLIALEPEAASIYCREMKMREFKSEKGDANISDVFARPGSKYLVIDIGGNSVKCSWALLTKKSPPLWATIKFQNNISQYTGTVE